jgi:hypothetical protein
MKAAKWVAGVFALLLIGGLLLALQQGWIRVGRDGARVEQVLGQVGLGCNSAELQPIKKATSLGADCVLATGQLSLARIHLPVNDARFELRELSSLRVHLSSSEPDEYAIELRQGLIRAVSSVTSTPRYRVGTPTVAVGVRGTTFVVQYDPAYSLSTIWLEQGLVEVKPTNPALPPVTLQPGQKVQVTPESISPVTNEPPPAMPEYPEPVEPAGDGGRAAIGGTWEGTCTTARVSPDTNNFMLGNVKQIRNFVIAERNMRIETPGQGITSVVEVRDDWFRSVSTMPNASVGFEFRLAGPNQVIGTYHARGENYSLEDDCVLNRISTAAPGG